MVRGVLGTIAVAVLLVSAGCSGLLDPGPSRGTYDVPERTETFEDRERSVENVSGGGRASGGVAPGTGAGGIRNPDALASEHAASLANRSFTVTVNRTIRFSNGTVRHERTTTQLAADRDRYHVLRSTTPPGTNESVVTELWGGGGKLYRSVTGPDDVYRQGGSQLVPVGEAGACSPPGVPDPTYGASIREAFSRTTVQGVRLSSEGERSRVYLLRAYAGSTESFAIGASTAEDVQVEAIVESEGPVRYLYLNYQTRLGTTWASITITYHFEEIGSTTVERRYGVDGSDSDDVDCPPPEENG